MSASIVEKNSANLKTILLKLQKYLQGQASYSFVSFRSY